MNIIIYTDSSNSWFVHHGQKLKVELLNMKHKVKYIHKPSDLYACDLMFLLSCTKLLESKYLRQNKNNIVVHASDLPKGKGFSPLQWQVLEGKNEIPLTLFEAVDEVDAGPYYFKDSIRLSGYELLDELRDKMASKIIEMCVRFVRDYESLECKFQIGDSTFYRRRKTEDDELDVSKSLEDQFNHFRIADNENHPLFFKYYGYKYYIKIFKEEKN